MRIGYVSDLHQEFWNWNLLESPYTPGEVDVLIFAGDIHVSAREARKVFEKIDCFAPMIYVLGNHEYYHHTFPDALDRYREQLSKVKNVTVLEKDTVDIKGVRFYGTTLWSNLSDKYDSANARAGLSDFKGAIKKNGKMFTPKDCTEEHFKCREWLDSELAKPFDGPKVVITHHSPTPLTCAPQFEKSKLRPCFESNLEDIMFKHKPAVWIYGHDHNLYDNKQIKIFETWLMTNQLGYPQENNAGRRNVWNFTPRTTDIWKS